MYISAITRMTDGWWLVDLVAKRNLVIDKDSENIAEK